MIIQALAIPIGAAAPTICVLRQACIREPSVNVKSPYNDEPPDRQEKRRKRRGVPRKRYVCSCTYTHTHTHMYAWKKTQGGSLKAVRACVALPYSNLTRCET